MARDQPRPRKTILPRTRWRGAARPTGRRYFWQPDGRVPNFTEMSPSLILGKNVFEIGDFKLIRKIGEGAMGAVYKAQQVSFKNRVVALKILFPHVANNPKLVKRLYREGMVMGQLDHQNIVQAFAIGEAQGFHYIAMEYVSGRSMQKWLVQLGRLPVGDAVRIVLVAPGHAAIHMA